MLLSLFLALWLALPAPSEPPAWCRQLPRAAYKDLTRITVVDPWFEVYRIRPGVFAIYEPHQYEEVISYLILGQKRGVLFDTGMGISNIRKVVEELTPLPVSVVNSHTHNDHVGDNWRFADVYGMDTDFTRQNAKGSTADAQAEIAPDEICGKLPAAFDASSYATKPFHISHWLHDGDKIDLGDRTIEVIATPGHTPDAITLVDRGNGLLWTGDSYYAGPIYLYRPETDLAAYVTSMRKLAALAPSLKLLLPSHNVPVANPAELQRVLAAMEQVRSGKIKPAPNGENWEYKFEGFSFLMSK